MPTIEERHECAKKLREIELVKLPDASSELEEVHKAIGCWFGQEHFSQEFNDRLADLIDPTCEVHRDTVFKPAVLYPDRELDDVGRDETVFRCGKCCEIVSYDEDYNPETDSPAYCETCGSRIIGIGEPWNE